ncbi:MAG: hypothetical protein HYY35_01735 [Deltaproteobacteria bacterium]|nr:hypothetical protein [Deltaproteobacteria bacterium]
MSDVYQRIEAHVVALGGFLERARRYRPLAVDAQRLYGAASRIAARVRRASRTRESGEHPDRLERELAALVEQAQRSLRAFLEGTAYRALLSSLERGDDVEVSRRVAEVFADVEPAAPTGRLYLPLSSRRGERRGASSATGESAPQALEPDAAVAMVAAMARDGIEPQPGPGVGGDENVRPIRFYEGTEGVDAALLLIVEGSDVRAPAFRSAELRERLVYVGRLRVPLAAGLQRQSPDDWLELRAGGYPQYRSRCRELLQARGIDVVEI